MRAMNANEIATALNLSLVMTMAILRKHQVRYVLIIDKVRYYNFDELLKKGSTEKSVIMHLFCQKHNVAESDLYTFGHLSYKLRLSKVKVSKGIKNGTFPPPDIAFTTVNRDFTYWLPYTLNKIDLKPFGTHEKVEPPKPEQKKPKAEPERKQLKKSITEEKKPKLGKAKLKPRKNEDNHYKRTYKKDEYVDVYAWMSAIKGTNNARV